MFVNHRFQFKIIAGLAVLLVSFPCLIIVFSVGKDDLFVDNYMLSSMKTMCPSINNVAEIVYTF